MICFAGDLIGRGDMAYEKEMQIQLAEEHFIQPLLKAVSLTKKEFILQSHFSFSPTFFNILHIILPFHQNIFRNFTNKKTDIFHIIFS